MKTFPHLRLTGQPGYADALDRLGPARDLPLLVLYHGELERRAFLLRILSAAGYPEPGTQLHLLEWSPTTPLDLAGLLRACGARQVILFGYEPAPLGLHFSVSQYFPVEVAGVRYLLADSLEFIETTKAAGDNRAAGALWKGVQDGFAV